MAGSNFLPQLPDALADAPDLDALHRSLVAQMLELDYALGLTTNNDITRAHVEVHMRDNPIGKSSLSLRGGGTIDMSLKDRICKAVEVLFLHHFLSTYPDGISVIPWQKQPLLLCVPLTAISTRIMGIPSVLPAAHPFYKSADAGEAFSGVIVEPRGGNFSAIVKKFCIAKREALPPTKALAIYGSFQAQKVDDNSSPFISVRLDTFFPVPDTHYTPANASLVTIIPDNVAGDFIGIAEGFKALATQITVALEETDVGNRAGDLADIIDKGNACARQRLLDIAAERSAPTTKAEA